MLVGYFFLSCSASEQLHSSLSSYAKVDRAHPHTRIYKRSYGASLYVSACSIYFCIATPTSSLTATRAELYYFVVVIIHVREADEKQRADHSCASTTYDDDRSNHQSSSSFSLKVNTSIPGYNWTVSQYPEKLRTNSSKRSCARYPK